MMIEMSERQSGDPSIMKKANLFISELDEVPKKYTETERKEFMEEFKELTDHERYTCVEVILSNAWGHINADKRAKARADLAFVLPLCVERDRKELYYPDFEIDRMIWESWVNDETLSQEKKEENNQLMNQCGFRFENFTKKVPKKEKSGFQRFLNALKCKCCARASG